MSNEVIPFDADVLGLLRGSFGHDGIPLPFVHEIFLMETPVAGTSYIDQIEKIDKELCPQELIVLKREPGNPHDHLAVLIIDPRGRKIGYIPRDRNEIPARLMDAGKLLFGTVKSKHWKHLYLVVIIRIFMRDT